MFLSCFFFFQAEDGIRDKLVTGVQTCALPIFHELPPDFVALAATATCPFAAARHKTRPFYGVQFHPEVTHTPRGEQLFQNFLYEICRCSGSWTMGNFVEQTVASIRRQVGDARVICGLSGGVDSSVTASL